VRWRLFCITEQPIYVRSLTKILNLHVLSKQQLFSSTKMHNFDFSKSFITTATLTTSAANIDCGYILLLLPTFSLVLACSYKWQQRSNLHRSKRQVKQENLLAVTSAPRGRTKANKLTSAELQRRFTCKIAAWDLKEKPCYSCFSSGTTCPRQSRI